MRIVLLGYVALLLAIVALADLGALGPLLAIAHADGADKLIHFALALGLGALLEATSPRPARGALLALPVVIGEELSQLAIPCRSFDVGDLAADLLGLALGVAALHLSRAHRGRRAIACDREESA